MKKARIGVLILTLLVPGLLWVVLHILYLPAWLEVQGTASVPSLYDEILAAKAKAGNQEAKDKLLANVRDEVWRNIMLPIGGPIMGIGMVAVWVMSPGRARQRLRAVAQVALAGWTVFVALRLAFTDIAPLAVAAEATKATALWVAGLAPCLMILYWTRPPQN